MGSSVLRIVNLRTGTVIADKARRADSFLSRLIGLIGRRGLESDEALVIPKCSMVHCWFMRFPIDVVFCSPENLIVAIEKAIRPWSASRYYSSATYVIEIGAGRSDNLGLRMGDVIEINSIVTP